VLRTTADEVDAESCRLRATRPTQNEITTCTLQLGGILVLPRKKLPAEASEVQWRYSQLCHSCRLHQRDETKQAEICCVRCIRRGATEFGFKPQLGLVSAGAGLSRSHSYANHLRTLEIEPARRQDRKVSSPIAVEGAPGPAVLGWRDGMLVRCSHCRDCFTLAHGSTAEGQMVGDAGWQMARQCTMQLDKHPDLGPRMHNARHGWKDQCPVGALLKRWRQQWCK